jgi:hypothetical protein
MSVRVQAWLVVGTLVAAVFVSNPYAFLPHPARTSGQPKPDFLAFYAAGTVLREDRAHLYGEQRQADIQSAALGEKVSPEHPGFMPFVYPALAALLFFPVALLPYPAAFIAMLAFNVLLCGLALDLLCRKFKLSRGAGRLLVLSAALSIPVILTLANGQVSFLVLLLFIMLLSDIRAGNARAGFWTGLLALKPTLMPVFLLRFAMKREWKALAYTAMTASAVLLASLALAGPQAMPDYWDMSLKMASGQYATANTAHMTNLRSISEFFGYGQAGGVVLSLVVLALAALKLTEKSDISCSVLILAALLIAPHLHYQDLNPIWIVVAMGLGSLSTITTASRWGVLGGTLLTTVLVFTLASRQSSLPLLPAALLAAFLILTLKSWTRPQAAAQIPTKG